MILKKSGFGRVLIRFVTSKLRKKLREGGEYLSYIARINQLKDEIELLTAYSSDTVYRLRYSDMKYDYISPSSAKLLGYTPEELKQMNIRSLIEDTRLVHDSMKKVQSYSWLEAERKSGEAKQWQADYLMKTRDGGRIWVSDVSYPWHDKNGSVIGSIGVLRDISGRIKAEEEAQAQMIKMVNTDLLTGFISRSSFFERLEEEQKRARRHAMDFCIILIDIDRFKKINASYGHEAGDAIIINVSQQIRKCLRETDMAARLSGEEFGVILPDTRLEGAYYVADRIRELVEVSTINSNNQKLSCTVSIGVAEHPHDNVIEINQLYKTADTRLFIAKSTGRNQVSVDEIIS